MNVIGLVFSLMLILSYGFYACWDKQLASSRLRTTYVRHEKANRKILNSYQSQAYKDLGGKGIAPLKPEEEELFEEEEIVEQKAKKPEMNRHCSKINLYPLIQQGREQHPLLYEIAAKMIRTFYSPLQNQKKRFEYHFLDSLLLAAKGADALEKVDLIDPELQQIYYRMLKGTKKWDLPSGLGYPSLLDYLKIEPSPDKICISHAHPDLLTVLFNEKIAARLHSEIHQQNHPLLTEELIERICLEAHQITLDRTIFTLLELGYPHHEEQRKTFIANDGDITLRKNISLKS